MAIDALVRPLLGVSLFQGLSPLQITEIARRAGRTVYRPGEVIIRDRASANAAVLIVSGDAVRVRGPELSVPAEPVPTGALLAEMAMLIETVHTSTVVARTAVRALCISREEILAQMAEDPALADHFVSRISRRLKALADDLRQLDRVLAQGARARGRQRLAPRASALPMQAEVYH
jgi:CRP-like cAMP-binding protein